MPRSGQLLEEILGAERSQAERIWQSHGEVLLRMPAIEARQRVLEWLALLGATHSEAQNVLALVETRLRDAALPADTSRKRMRGGHNPPNC